MRELSLTRRIVLSRAQRTEFEAGQGAARDPDASAVRSANSTMSGKAGTPPALTARRGRPFARIVRAISGKASAVAHSTTMSACSGSSASGTTLGGARGEAQLRAAFSRSRAETAVTRACGRRPFVEPAGEVLADAAEAGEPYPDLEAPRRSSRRVRLGAHRLRIGVDVARRP